jgi:hypothetical protein
MSSPVQQRKAKGKEIIIFLAPNFVEQYGCNLWLLEVSDRITAQ